MNNTEIIQKKKILAAQKKYKEELEKQFHQIINSKFYKLWQKYASFKTKKLIEKIKRKKISYEKIVFPKSVRPEISIIIITYNKWGLTHACLKSIVENNQELRYEVIIIDNKSNDDTVFNLKNNVFGAHVVINKKNIFFGGGCNQGVNISRGKYIYLLNNDTLVYKDTIKSLLQTIKSNPKIGAVGSKLIYPNKQLQEAGSMLWKNGSAMGYGRGENPNKPEYNFLRTVDFCSGSSILTRKELYQKAKGMDLIYLPAYYEETDLCQKIIKLGYSIVYQPNSVVTHYEYGSTSSKKAEELMKKNQKIFFSRWKNELLKKPKQISKLNILKNRNTPTKYGVLIVVDKIILENPIKTNILNNNIKKIIEKNFEKYQITILVKSSNELDNFLIEKYQSLGIEVFQFIKIKKLKKSRKDFYIKIYYPHLKNEK